MAENKKQAQEFEKEGDDCLIINILRLMGYFDISYPQYTLLRKYWIDRLEIERGIQIR